MAGLHDVAPEAYGDFPSACGFALALAVRRLADTEERRPLLWCRLETEQREYGACFGHGIAGFGLPRARFLTLSLKQPIALLWTFEEALKSGCLSLVLVTLPCSRPTSRPRAALRWRGRRAGLPASPSSRAIIPAPPRVSAAGAWLRHAPRLPLPIFVRPSSGLGRLPHPQPGRTSRLMAAQLAKGSCVVSFHSGSRFSGGALHPARRKKRAPVPPPSLPFALVERGPRACALLP